MACDTFIKIAVKCRRHFVTVQVGEVMPFIDEILSTISSIICDLQTQQVRFAYTTNHQSTKLVQLRTTCVLLQAIGISAESLDHNKTPPSLILKIELFAFVAIFARFPLVKSILLEVLYGFHII